jgi:hypothetical protein
MASNRFTEQQQQTLMSMLAHAVPPGHSFMFVCMDSVAKSDGGSGTMVLQNFEPDEIPKVLAYLQDLVANTTPSAIEYTPGEAIGKPN